MVTTRTYQDGGELVIETRIASSDVSNAADEAVRSAVVAPNVGPRDPMARRPFAVATSVLCAGLWSMLAAFVLFGFMLNGFSLDYGTGSQGGILLILTFLFPVGCGIAWYYAYQSTQGRLSPFWNIGLFAYGLVAAMIMILAVLD